MAILFIGTTDQCMWNVDKKLFSQIERSRVGSVSEHPCLLTPRGERKFVGENLFY